MRGSEYPARVKGLLRSGVPPLVARSATHSVCHIVLPPNALLGRQNTQCVPYSAIA